MSSLRFYLGVQVLLPLLFLSCLSAQILEKESVLGDFVSVCSPFLNLKRTLWKNHLWVFKISFQREEAWSVVEAVATLKLHLLEVIFCSPTKKSTHWAAICVSYDVVNKDPMILQKCTPILKLIQSVTFAYEINDQWTQPTLIFHFETGEIFSLTDYACMTNLPQ